MLLLVVATTALAALGAPVVPPGGIRAVVSDMDGTLFTFAGREISPANKQVLLECIANEVHVCLATGRLPGPWSDELREALPGLGPCVFGNGAVVMDAAGDVIWEAQLPRDIIEAVIDWTKGGIAGAATAGRLVVLAATRWETADKGHSLRYCELAPHGPSHITQLIDGAGEPAAVLLPNLDGFEDRQVVKFVIWTNPGEPGWASMPDTVAALSDVLGGTGATILNHGERWCEILPPKVNKGTGVARLLEHLAVSPRSALALGDAENDVEMLRLAGIGVAMGNAQPAALDAADVVVASNVDDGVAQAVRRFVSPQWAR